MSRKTRIIISCVLVVVAFAAGILTYIHANGNRTEVANAEGGTEYFVDANGKIKVPDEPKAGATVTDAERDENRKNRGKEGNPFFILEIAPYEGEGQFGYHIPGQEPVDVDLMAWAGKNVYGEDDLYKATTAKICIWEKDLPAKYTGGSEGNTTQYGIMTYVTDGSGTHNRIDEVYAYEAISGDYTGDRYALDETAEGEKYVLDENGTFMQRVVGGTYKEEKGGSYKWEPLSVDECLEIDKDSDEKKTYVESYHEGESFKTYFEGVKYYYKDSAKVLTHNNHFLRESVGLAYDIINGERVKVSEEEVEKRIRDYHVVLYTVTPEDLNQNLELIDRADLITFVTKDNTSAARNAFEENNGYYLRDGKFTRANTDAAKRVENKYGATFATNQLDWDAAVRIYQRVTDDKKPCPVLWDSQTYEDISTKNLVELEFEVTFANGDKKIINKKGTENNLYKLYLLLYHMPSTTFEMLFGDPSSFKSENMNGVADKSGALQTGVLNDVYKKKEANRYWNEFTFYPWSILPDDSSTEYGPVLDSLGIMNDGAGALFSFASGGSQNFLRNSVYRNDGGTFFHSGFMKASNVKNDQYGHEVYDFFASIKEPKETVTSAECLYYLLNGYTSASMYSNDEKYKILELQPSPDYLPQKYWDILFSTYAYTTQKPEVVKMTTSEFIGKNVECIGEYDLVYIGMNKLSTDLTMHSNFTYAHTGPKVQLDEKYTALHGWLGTADKKIQSWFAYSGNDLTELTKKKLVEFAGSGAALMFGNGFFTSAEAKTVADTIDLNSNVYDLASSVSSKVYEKALSDAAYHVKTKVALQNALSNGRRVKMNVLVQPNIYVESKTDAEKYINGTESTKNNHTLRYEFKLNAPAGNSYEVALYADVNGDGRFSEDENVDMNVTNSAGNGVSKVEGGNTYVVKHTIDDRIGSVSWKLDIVKDKVVYDSVSGVSAIKVWNKSDKIDLCILQIIPEKHTPGVPTTEPICTVYLPQEGEVNGDTVTGLPEGTSEAVKNVTKRFYELTQDINGMDITFVRKTQTEVSEALLANPNYLKHTYDMIIIGFADVYEGITLLDVSSAITDFIASGRAVLFTHDTASLSGPTGEGEEPYPYWEGNLGWGETYTKTYRDLFAMDRYNVLAHGGSKTADRDDYPYMTTNDAKEINKLLEESGVALAQGMTNATIQRYKTVGDNLTATKVSQVNTGAITEYPYKILPEIDVALTHAQYYQLDMERDDIVVWYCLDGSDSSNEGIKKYYEASPNDVRNNYYIYNAGNITYSGVGHNGELTENEMRLFVNTFVAAYRASAKPVEAVIVNDDATKDTVGNYYLCVDVDSSDAGNAFGNEIVSGYHVQETEEGGGFKEGELKEEQSKRVYFRIKNNNLYGNTSYDLKFYINGSATPTPLAVYKKDGDVFMDTKTEDTKFKATNIDIYYVDVPLTKEKNALTNKEAIGTTDLTISIIMKYGTEGYVTDPSNTDAVILPRGLFDLD